MSYHDVNLDAFLWEQCQRSPLWVPSRMDETPASTYCTAAGTTCEPPSIAELQAIMDHFPRPEHDVVVTTKTIWDQLRQSPEFAGEREQTGWSDLDCYRILGLPVEVHPGSVAAYLRAEKLQKDGQRVMLVLEKPDVAPNPVVPAANTSPENAGG